MSSLLHMRRNLAQRLRTELSRWTDVRIPSTAVCFTQVERSHVFSLPLYFRQGLSPTQGPGYLCTCDGGHLRHLRVMESVPRTISQIGSVAASISSHRGTFQSHSCRRAWYYSRHDQDRWYNLLLCHLAGAGALCWEAQRDAKCYPPSSGASFPLWSYTTVSSTTDGRNILDCWDLLSIVLQGVRCHLRRLQYFDAILAGCCQCR